MVLLGVVGCGPTAPTGLPDGVRVEVLQGRSDYSSETLVIRIINGSTIDLTVTGARLDAAGFAEPAVVDRVSHVRAGTTVDLRAPVPEADCVSGPGEPHATLTVGSGDTVTVPAGDPLGTLERLHSSGCIAGQVDTVADVSVGAPVIEGSGREAVAVLPLTVAPTGAAGRIEITGVASTPLLRPDPAAAATDADNWPVSVAIDAVSAPATVQLRVVPARCDPHAIAEDKVGTVLVLTVATPSGETGSYRLVPAEDVRQALLDFVSDTCEME